MNCQLPNFFTHKPSKNLIRLGCNNDGGYLISQDDIYRTDILVTMGLYDDWSFEKDFLNKHFIDLISYDGSVSRLIFFSRFFFNAIKLKFKKSKRWLIALKKYSFFKSNKKHIKKHIGTKKNQISIDEIFSNLTSYQNIFFKIDIESSEYEILDTLIKHQYQISGMAIEFHDCAKNINAIENFIRDFELNLVHVHANNNSSIDENMLIPNALELTFSRYGNLSNTQYSYHPLDQRCNPNKPEYYIII